jgi:hypothetical protein
VLCLRTSSKLSTKLSSDWCTLGFYRNAAYFTFLLCLLILCAPPYVTLQACSDMSHLPLCTLISISCRKATAVRSCSARAPSSSLQPLSIHTAPQPGGSLSPICFASHRALSQLTSPCNSNLARPLHTCCGYLLGSVALKPISIAASVASCCNPVTICGSWFAHSWGVSIRSESICS